MAALPRPFWSASDRRRFRGGPATAKVLPRPIFFVAPGRRIVHQPRRAGTRPAVGRTGAAHLLQMNSQIRPEPPHADAAVRKANGIVNEVVTVDGRILTLERCHRRCRALGAECWGSRSLIRHATLAGAAAMRVNWDVRARQVLPPMRRTVFGLRRGAPRSRGALATRRRPLDARLYPLHRLISAAVTWLTLAAEPPQAARTFEPRRMQATLPYDILRAVDWRSPRTGHRCRRSASALPIARPARCRASAVPAGSAPTAVDQASSLKKRACASIMAPTSGGLPSTTAIR